jgi:hypothetical protein
VIAQVAAVVTPSWDLVAAMANPAIPTRAACAKILIRRNTNILYSKDEAFVVRNLCFSGLCVLCTVQ